MSAIKRSAITLLLEMWCFMMHIVMLYTHTFYDYYFYLSTYVMAKRKKNNIIIIVKRICRAQNERITKIQHGSRNKNQFKYFSFENNK